MSLTVKPGASNLSPAQQEALWRDPAMKQLGYGPGLSGVQSYIDGLRTKLGSNWSYCGFFTKYPVGHFAYATLGGPRLVMQYSNDGWGPDNIDRVFAHESGHIFGAPDEYAASGCDCGGQWGYFKVPNTNCAACAAGGGVACIMKQNDWAMCPSTPYHLGFLQALRYSGVFLPGAGGYGLWVNADWASFQAKWQEWSGQGLRLTDLEIANIGGQTRYSGVYSAGTGGYGLWVGADWSSFQAKWKEWSGQGLRLVDFATTTTGIEVAASQVASLVPAGANGSGSGFASLGGVTIAGHTPGLGSPAGMGVGMGRGAPASVSAGEQGGFGEAVLGDRGAVSEVEGSAGFGQAVLGASTGDDAAGAAGFVSSVLGRRPDALDEIGAGEAVLTPAKSSSAPELSPAGFGASYSG